MHRKLSYAFENSFAIGNKWSEWWRILAVASEILKQRRNILWKIDETFGTLFVKANNGRITAAVMEEWSGGVLHRILTMDPVESVACSQRYRDVQRLQIVRWNYFWIHLVQTVSSWVEFNCCREHKFIYSSWNIHLNGWIDEVAVGIVPLISFDLFRNRPVPHQQLWLPC